MEQNKTLGKLLAKENITIQHGNYRTAWFDIKDRTLGLPAWADNGKDVYDLLIGHEVGHALFTPYEGWHDSPEKLKGCPRSYINVIEDARIERKIRNEYPGLVGPFLRGYKVLADQEFFGDLSDLDFDKVKLIDKINLKAKLGKAVSVPFNAEEKDYFDRAMNNETFDEVVELCKDILAYTKENQPELLEPPKLPELPENFPAMSDDEENDYQPPQGHDDMEALENDETDSEEQSQGGAENNDDDTEKTDESTDSEEEGEADEKASEESNIAANPEHNQGEEDSSITDNIFRDKECGLVEVNEKGYQTLHCNEIQKDILKTVVISHKQLAKERLETQAKFPSQTILNDNKTKFEEFMKSSRKNVNFAVKEFEMRKAAHQWQRATTAKSGSLDVNKVHSYKFNEDIFAKVTSLADAKNHGMMMIIDYSGSMCYSLPGVIDQLMHLVQFCKAVNIPFEVYAFTSTNQAFRVKEDKYGSALPGESKRVNELRKRFKDGSLDMNSLCMPLLVSSELKKSEFKLAMHHLFSTMQDRWDTDAIKSPHENLGSTPLNQALVVSHSLIRKFKVKHNVEKMNFVCLSDGDTNRMSVFQDSKLEDNKVKTGSEWRHGAMNIVCDGKIVPCRDRGKLATEDLLSNIKKRYNTTNLGFFIADDVRHFHNRVYAAMQSMNNKSEEYVNYYSDEYANMKKTSSAEYRKNKCVVKENALGYDEYYVLKNGSTLKTEEDNNLDHIDADATTATVRNAFKKMSKSKKNNKVLLTRFGKAVA